MILKRAAWPVVSLPMSCPAVLLLWLAGLASIPAMSAEMDADRRDALEQGTGQERAANYRHSVRHCQRDNCGTKIRGARRHLPRPAHSKPDS